MTTTTQSERCCYTVGPSRLLLQNDRGFHWIQSSKFSTTTNLDGHEEPDVDTTQAKKASQRRRRTTTFIPQKAAVSLTNEARTIFKDLLSRSPRPNIVGIWLTNTQSRTGQPRMVYGFSFVTADELSPQDEAVSLQVVQVIHSNDDGDTTTTSTTTTQENESVLVVPKAPTDARNDGLPKLHVSADAFLKVLGATVDVDRTSMTPILYNKEGNRMDPNA